MEDVIVLQLVGPGLLNAEQRSSESCTRRRVWETSGAKVDCVNVYDIILISLQYLNKPPCPAVLWVFPPTFFTVNGLIHTVTTCNSLRNV